MKVATEPTTMPVRNPGWEILAAPRLVAWVGNDVELSDAEKVALLRRDVYLVDLPVLRENGAPWLRPWSHAYAINFDYIKRYKNRFRKHDDAMVANDICRKIAALKGIPCIVYGSGVSQAEAEIFGSQGVNSVCGEVKSKVELLSFLRSQVLPHVTGQQRREREVVRLRVGTGVRIQVAISMISGADSQGSVQVFRGVLSDISPRGVGVNLFHRTGIRLLQERQLASMHIAWHSAGITIKKAVVTRVDENSGSVGLSFNLENCDCFGENDAYRLGKFIGDQIGNAMRSEFQFARYGLS